MAYVDDDFRGKCDAMLAQAREWVDSLPREVLGAFAVDAEALATEKLYSMWVNAYGENRHNELIEVSKLTTNAILDALEASDSFLSALDGEVHTSSYDVSTYNTIVDWEMRFWLKQSGEWQDENEQMGEEDFIYIIANNTDKHSFFESGIWDIPFITKCIDDGIDVEMALSIMKSAEVSVA